MWWGGGGAPEGGGTSAPAADFTKQGDIELWTGKDTSGNLPKLIKQFNDSHPNGKVTLHELPDEADQQQQQMIQNTQIKNPKMAVLNVDVVWTAQFAANSYVEALPPDLFPTDGMLKATVDSATYFDKLYAYPRTSNGGLLFYRKDLLDKYSLEVPTTFDEMKAACDKIIAGEKNSKLACFAGQYNKYEGLTVNFDEAVHGAGGVIVGDDGKPNVATPEATLGLQTLTDWFKDGYIPKAAITWTEEEGRKAFQDGELVFHRNWPYVYTLCSQDRWLVQDQRQVRVWHRCLASRSLVCPALAVATTASPRMRRTRVRRPTSLSSWRRQSRRSRTPWPPRTRRLSSRCTPIRTSSRSSPTPRHCSSRSRPPSHVRRLSSTAMSPWRSRMPPMAHSKVRLNPTRPCKHCRLSCRL